MGSQRCIRFSDEVLISKLRHDEENVFGLLDAAYRAKLCIYVSRLVRDTAAAQDIVQEVFVSLWLRRHEVMITGSLHNYLHTAVRYRAINYLEANNSAGKKLERAMKDFRVYDDSIQERQSAHELEAVLNRQVKKLPAKMKEVFLLSRQECLSHREISELLNISNATVKKQIGNALKLVRGPLEEYLFAS